jgi:hypothetical protein
MADLETNGEDLLGDHLFHAGFDAALGETF